jgi:hypothetical protein
MLLKFLIVLGYSSIISIGVLYTLLSWGYESLTTESNTGT